MSLPRFPFVYIDAFSGASGDLFLGALLDLGYPLAALRKDLEKLPVEGVRLHRRRMTRGGLSAVRVTVATKREQPHRGRREIHALLRRSRLDPPVRRRCLEIFDAIIDAEARLHGIPPQRVHLHEVGALDALADIVGTVSAFHGMGVEDICGSPVNVGTGMVRCAHGELPVPAPATAALLRDVPVYGAGQGEKTTPTGAALLTSLCSAFGPLPLMKIHAVGQGAGRREDPARPNILRLLAGERVQDHLAPAGGILEHLVEIRSQIDDTEPRILGHLMERLHAAGALDIYFSPIQMKKNRPGTLVAVLATATVAARLASVIMAETFTLGYRIQRVERISRPRKTVTVRTSYGKVRVKIAAGDGIPAVVTPEFEDCRRLACSHSVPFRMVLDAALEAFRHRGATRRQRP